MRIRLAESVESPLSMTREFVNDTAFKKRLAQLRALDWPDNAAFEGNPIVKAVGAVRKLAKSKKFNSRKSQRFEELFTKPGLLPWHWKILLSRLADKETRSRLRCQAVFRYILGYAYYEISDTDGTLVAPPKFEPFDRENWLTTFVKEPEGAILSTEPGIREKLRGIGDLALALAGLTKAIDPFDDFTVITDLQRKNDRDVEWAVEFEAFQNSQNKQYVLTIPFEAERASGHTVPHKRDSQKVLIPSRKVAEGFEKLANLWHTPGFATFMLSAPPGSGKEVMLKAMCSGLDMDFKPVVLGGQKVESIAESLFGSRSKPGLLSHYRKEKKDARSTLLFFDEVDKCDPAHRSMLLRVVESRDYFDGDKGEVCELSKQLHFGFAGSEALAKSRLRDPIDFWTRIEYSLQLDHPLEDAWRELHQLKEERYERAVLAHYFRYFWTEICRSASDHQGISSYERALVGCLNEEDPKSELTKQFLDYVMQHKPWKPSVRAMRFSVKALFTDVYNEALEKGHSSQAILTLTKGKDLVIKHAIDSANQD